MCAAGWHFLQGHSPVLRVTRAGRPAKRPQTAEPQLPLPPGEATANTRLAQRAEQFFETEDSLQDPHAQRLLGLMKTGSQGLEVPFPLPNKPHQCISAADVTCEALPKTPDGHRKQSEITTRLAIHAPHLGPMGDELGAHGQGGEHRAPARELSAYPEQCLWSPNHVPAPTLRGIHI